MASNVIYETILTDLNLPRVGAMAALFLVLALASLGFLAATQRWAAHLWQGRSALPT